MKTIKKITKDIIEVVEEVSQTRVQQINRNVLKAEKKKLENQIEEINEYLGEFEE